MEEKNNTKNERKKTECVKTAYLAIAQICSQVNTAGRMIFLALVNDFSQSIRLLLGNLLLMDYCHKQRQFIMSGQNDQWHLTGSFLWIFGTNDHFKCDLTLWIHFRFCKHFIL